MNRLHAVASVAVAGALLLGGCTGGSEGANPPASPSASSVTPGGGTNEDVAAQLSLGLTLGSVDRVVCPLRGKYGDAISEDIVSIRSVTICVPKFFMEGYTKPLTIEPTAPWQWQQVKKFTMPNTRRPADCPPDFDQYRVFVNTDADTYLVYLPVDGCGIIRAKVVMALNRLVADTPARVEF